MQNSVTKLEASLVKLESDQNSMAQYGRRNNVVLTRIPEIDKDNKIRELYIFDKPGQQKSKKTMIRFVNALINNKKLKNVNNGGHKCSLP